MRIDFLSCHPNLDFSSILFSILKEIFPQAPSDGLYANTALPIQFAIQMSIVSEDS
jgi:hypothetical protein